MSKNIFLIVLILVSITVSLLSAQQTDLLEKPSPTEPTVSREIKPVPAQDIQQSLEMEVAILREKVETTSGRINLLISFLIVILAIGGITSVVGWFRTERRTGEAHSVAMNGEQASQERSAEVHRTFLSGSKDTLELVNETLTLAKKATERATKDMENKANNTLKKLDEQSKDLIEDALAQEDDRALVAKPDKREQLSSLAQKIGGLETFQDFFQFELTPHCKFIRGMEHHLKQHFMDAFECWRSVALDKNTDPILKRLSWYWVGYEHNNLCNFPEAEINFKKALETATGIRRFELQRILIETRFFNKKTVSPETLISPFKDLLNSIEKELGNEGMSKKKAEILNTLGNIYFQIGNEHRANSNDTKAKENYQLAKECYEKARGQAKWVLFSLAETLYKLGERNDTEKLFRNAKDEAIVEYICREEPRTKVLARTTELICCIRVKGLREEATGIHSQVIEALGRVDNRLTVYSQIQKRNVTKDEFRQDLAELMKELVL